MFETAFAYWQRQHDITYILSYSLCSIQGHSRTSMTYHSSMAWAQRLQKLLT